MEYLPYPSKSLSHCSKTKANDRGENYNKYRFYLRLFYTKFGVMLKYYSKDVGASCAPHKEVLHANPDLTLGKLFDDISQLAVGVCLGVFLWA